MLIAVVFAGCANAPPEEQSIDSTANFTFEAYHFSESYDLLMGLDETWTFEAHEGATVKAKFYSVGPDSLAPGAFCFQADTPTGTHDTCGNGGLQIGPDFALGNTYYDETSGPGMYAFSALAMGAGQFFVEIDVTYP
jgi:hypothetical protein